MDRKMFKMGVKHFTMIMLFGLTYHKGVECTCSSLYSQIQTDKIATMCKSGVVQGVDVFIDTDLGQTLTLNSGTACRCNLQTQRGKQVKVSSHFAGPQRSNCGTSVDFTGGALGHHTVLSTPCYSYQFDVASHTYTNMSVGLRRDYDPYSSPYCIRFSLNYCGNNEHQCGDGTCIPAFNKCDFFPDCDDESDEISCGSITCSEGQIACDDNAFCINPSDRCDGVYQCPDQSDELAKYCDPDYRPGSNSDGVSNELPPPLITITCEESDFFPEPTTTTTSTTAATTSTTSISSTTPTTTPTSSTTTSSTTTTKPTLPTYTTTSSTTSTTTSTLPTSTTPSTTTTSTTPTSTTSITPVSSTVVSATPSTTPTTSKSTSTSTTTTSPSTTTSSSTPATTPTTTTASKPTTTTTATTPTTTTTITATKPTTTTTTTTVTTPTTTIVTMPTSAETVTTPTTKSTPTTKTTVVMPTTTTITTPTTTTTVTTPTTTSTPTTTTTKVTTAPKPRCNIESQFQCGNGSCIPISWRCDSLNDCTDNSDESGCSSYVCGENMFLCDERRTCIKSKERCNGKFECPDLSDELPKYCGTPTKAAPLADKDDDLDIAIIVGIVCGVLFLLLLLSCIVYWVKTKNW
ncbi:mucin-2-like isoform X1 [Ruditapes philippinarum]|uniref:mucin-2-like isoform X1 n=2 Tax=Ruditapes philippinarum TaxID=129788 RepID=UPI00295A5C43|nr:mucin-2-like isoform X1 [Ruditapes philippinarum]